MDKLISLLRFKFFRVNLLIFIFFSLAMTVICEKIPNRIFQYKKWLFKERKWEKGGQVYERCFNVKKWKAKLPDISDFMKWRFNKKHMSDRSSDYLTVFLMESCKSEFTHWMIILSAVLFNFWNGPAAAFFIFLFAAALNLPYIVIQRYNRPRLLKLLRHNTVNAYELEAAKI